MGRASKDSQSYKNVKRMKAIRDNYFHCVNGLRNSLVLSDSNKKSRNLYESYISDVQNAIKAMDGVDKRIIRNEIFNIAQPMWWIPYYSKSTYYRLRKKAIERFLKCFYE